MEERNNRFIINGQPDAVRHVCDKCMRVFFINGKYRTILSSFAMKQCSCNIRHSGKCQVIVGDGINMGHPCCGIFRCITALANNRHRFCPIHFTNHCICAVVGCSLPVVEDSKTCSLPEHQEMERLNKARGKAAFTLTERLQHAQSGDDHEDEDSETHEQWF
jgi:CxC6 like cysteine cluster associated with KDZ transposases